MQVCYPAGSVNAVGELIIPKGNGPFPTIILIPYYKGIDHVARGYAKRIIEAYQWGVFIADYYGEGRSTASDEEASRWMSPLLQDRKELRKRVEGAFEVVQALPEVDQSRLGVVGFCFGGLAAIELFRLGLDLKGVVAMHTLLKGGEAIKKHISSSLLVMNGYKDPLVTLEDRIAFEKEMDGAGVDWQYHLFGTAAHAFTNPEAKQHEGGLYYEPLAAKRSFEILGAFFSELFQR